MSLLLNDPAVFSIAGRDLLPGDRIRTAMGWSSPISHFAEVPADALFYGHPGGRVPHLAPDIPMRTIGVILDGDLFMVARPSLAKAA